MTWSLAAEEEEKGREKKEEEVRSSILAQSPLPSLPQSRECASLCPLEEEEEVVVVEEEE